jgi:MFS family permease
VGLLAAIYGIGWGIAALPVGLLGSRVGVKQSMLGGLVILAATSVAFGLADSYGELLATRFLQGTASTLCWAGGLAWLVDAAPRERRGEMIGIYTGATAAGSILGPVVGGLAVLVGDSEVFAGVAGFAFLLAIVGARFPGLARGERQSLALIWRAHSSGAVLRGEWLVALPGLLLGTIFVLAPLQLDRLSWGPIEIAGTFLVAAPVGMLARPLIGRWADRRGLLGALRLLLPASIPMTVLIPWVDDPWVLSACVVCAVSSYGILWGPAMALASHAYEEAGIAQVSGFGFMGLTSGVGFFVGAAAGGTIAHLTGDVAAYALAAGTCLATVVVLVLPPQPFAGRRAR